MRFGIFRFSAMSDGFRVVCDTSSISQNNPFVPGAVKIPEKLVTSKIPT